MRKSIAVAAVVCALIATAASGARAGANVAAGERFVLTGVVVLDGGSGLAWLQEPSLTGDRAVPVRPGERIGPYVLTKVLEDRVELEGPAGGVVVPLYNAQGSSGTAVASAGGPVQSPSVEPTVAPEPRPRPARGREAVIERMQAKRREPEQRQGASAKAAPQAQQPQAQQPQAQQPQAQQPPTQQGSAPAVVNPAPNNSDVVRMPVGDPRRRQSFQSMIGVN